VTEDELWDLDVGQLPAARRRWIERHAKGCGECAQALRALVEGEEPAPDVPQLPTAPREAAPELMEARSEFKVLLFRDPRRARLVIEPVKSARIAAARIDAPWAGSPSAARAGGNLEFDLGPAKSLRGRRVSLAIDLLGGVQVSLEVEL
jgi:anti-sigma factor RsiW